MMELKIKRQRFILETTISNGGLQEVKMGI